MNIASIFIQILLPTTNLNHWHEYRMSIYTDITSDHKCTLQCHRCMRRWFGYKHVRVSLFLFVYTQNVCTHAKNTHMYRQRPTTNVNHCHEYSMYVYKHIYKQLPTTNVNYSQYRRCMHRWFEYKHVRVPRYVYSLYIIFKTSAHMQATHICTDSIRPQM